jgi:hypothetical protein
MSAPKSKYGIANSSYLKAEVQHCACSHDGRGGLLTECQEHQEIREQRDELFIALRDLVEEARAEGHDDADDFQWQTYIRAAEEAIARAEKQ